MQLQPRPYLHLSTYKGAFLAVITDDPFLNHGHHNVLEADVVDTRFEANEWYFKMCSERPWERRSA